MIADFGQAIQTWWAPALAFAAGVVSFVSPCVLPLVPGYLSFVTGGQPPEEGKRARLLPILLFILGFSAVFTLIGALAGTALVNGIRSTTGQRVAGAFVLLFGLFMLLYAFRARIPWLYREERPLLSRVRPGPAGAFPLGAAFAFGWTPCIGPILAGILVIAGSRETVTEGVVLLAIYSLGLGIPFVLTSLAIDRFFSVTAKIRRYYHAIEVTSGALLVAIGVLIFTGQLTLITQFLTPYLPTF